MMTTSRGVRGTRYRLASSVGTVLALVGACLHYSLRDKSPFPRDTTNVVAYLEHVGPFWPIAFALATLSIVVAMVCGRARNLAHLVAAGVLAAYAFALFYTAASSGTGWVTACMTTGLCVHTIALAASYTQNGGTGWIPHSSVRSSQGSRDW